jgi:ribulose-5-phosphate 4-epimerase/fuculose-1-phosphate aldolase
MARLNLVGQDPERYDGAGYGNLSARIGPRGVGRGRRSFLITGTQTSGLAAIGLESFCLVLRYYPEDNRVESAGPIEPSSESMTHGAIYDLSPSIRYVFHAHAPVIWRRAAQLRLPTTDPRVEYGTPAMAAEVGRLQRSTALSELRCLAMGGHEDGVITFGRSAEEAGQAMMRVLARAFEAICARR